MTVIKVQNPNLPNGYYVSVGPRGLAVSTSKEQAKEFSNPHKVKREILALILDYRLPKKAFVVENY